MTRDEGSEEELGKAREMKFDKLFGLIPVLPENLDFKIRERTRNLRVHGLDAFDGGDQASHVLLAACGDEEKAREDHPGSGESQGCFTRAFLEEIKKPSSSDITYADFMESFPQLKNGKG